jgi:CRP-like cAMP-binding protein
MSNEQLKLDLVRFQKESCIVLADDQKIPNRFFIVREGNIRLNKKIHLAVEEHGDIIGPGDLFGVVSTMSGHNHVETAVAVTDVVIIAVRYEQFGQLIQNQIQVAGNILLSFSQRMRQLNESLATLTLKEKAPSDVDHLYHVAEYFAKEKRYKQAYYAFHQYIKYCPEGKYVQKVKEKLKKASPYAKAIKLDFEADETLRTYEKDDMIFAEGEPAEEVFIVKGGSVKITRVSQNSEILLEILMPGDIFGEMALLEEKPRSANAVAHEKCDLMVINQTNFSQMIKTQPQLVTKLIVMLAERIWTCYRRLTNTLIDDPLNRMYDMLLIQLERKRVNLNAKGPYTFDFGTNELFKMIRFSPDEGGDALKKVLKSHFVKIEKNSITVQDVPEFSKHVSFIRKKLEKDREIRNGQ